MVTSFPIFALPIAANVPPSTTINFYGSQAYPQSTEYPVSSSYYGIQSAPSAGTVIAGSATVQPGEYQIEWEVELAGTLVEGTDNDNFGLYVGAGLQADSINNAIAGSYPQEPLNVELSSSHFIQVKNIGAATAASDYSASLTITPLAAPTSSFCIPDIIIPSGWYMYIGVGNIQTTDQCIVNNVYLERYASNYADGQDELDTEAMLRRVIREEFNNQW